MVLLRASPPAVCTKPCGLPLTLSAPRHGDFPRSNRWSSLPVCALRSRVSPAPIKISLSLRAHLLLQTSVPKYNKWPRHHLDESACIPTSEISQVSPSVCSSEVAKGGMGRVSPIWLASISERPRHNCAAANGATFPLQLRHKGLTARGQVSTWRSPTDTLCPKTRGLSPQHGMGASSP